jgi:hypothetical protein
MPWHGPSDDWYLGGQGSVYDVNDREPAPRLINMKSVSRAAARALNKEARPADRQAGFIWKRS